MAVDGVRPGSATLEGCSVLSKAESMGVCFIGKRKLSNFLSNYMAFTPGRYRHYYVLLLCLSDHVHYLLSRFIDIESGLSVGAHRGVELFTVGQGAQISGQPQRYFVVSRRAPSSSATNDVLLSDFAGDILVAAGTDHPSLFFDSCWVELAEFSWVSGSPPISLNGRTLGFKSRYRQPILPCTIQLSTGPDQSTEMNVCFKEAFRAVSPGQILALYDGDVCLGGGIIKGSGPSYYEMGKSLKVPQSSRFVS